MTPQPGNRTVNAGAILVENRTPLPEPLRLESSAIGDSWARMANHPDGHELEETLAAAGWAFFYMAGKIRTIGFDFDGALKRLMTPSRLDGCNCMEIDNITTHSFLGMPFVSISAHARRIQKAMVFSDH
jgi:hypothetical protein